MAVAVVLAGLARAAVHIYSIPSESMVPALEVGDQIVVTRYLQSRPERGDVIVFQSPVGADELLVKRVIGLPGDWIDSRLGRVRIGGFTLPEPYLDRAAASGSIPSQFVPPDTYFVLGDNRESSLDSRTWGVVPEELIVGRARVVLWSTRHALGDEARAEQSDDLLRAPRPKQARVFKWID